MSFFARIRHGRHHVAWTRVLARIVALPIFVYVTYLVLINVALTTGVAKVIINRLAPTHVRIEYATAYSLWFMRVHTTQFAVRTTDASVQLRLTLDEAVTTFGITDFLSRRVRMYHARANGVTMRVRFTITPAQATPDYVAKLPPIAGLPDAPLQPDIMPPPQDDAHYNLWTAQVDDVVANDVREVWADAVHITDDGGYLKGGFYLRPMRSASMRPTEMYVANAAVSIGERIVASNVHALVTMSLEQFEMREVTGQEPLRFLDAHIIGASAFSALDFLNPMLASNAIAVGGGEGAVEMDFQLVHGVMTAGSRLEMVMKELNVSSGAHRVAGSMRLHAHVPNEGKPLRLSIETLGASLHHGEHQVAKAAYVGVAARIDDMDLSQPIERWAASVDIPEGHVPNLALLNVYLGETMFDAGSARIATQLNFDPTTANGHAKIDFDKARVRVVQSTAVATGSVELHLANWNSKTGHGEMSNVRIDLKDVAAGTVGGWWADFATGPVAFNTKHAHAIITLTGKCKDAQVPLEILSAPGLLWTVAGKQGFTVSVKATLNASAIDASDIRAIGNSLELTAHYRSDAHGKNGAGLLTTPVTNVGFVIVTGDLSLRPFASRDWYAHTRS